jgi:hypothetical protein
MAKATKFAALTALLLSTLNAANAESERCVPAADGRWLCGKDVSEADAAPLPEPQTRSLPPVMLIDPARFGEGDIDMDSPPDTSAAAPIVSEAAISEEPEIAKPAPTQMSAATPKPAKLEQPSTIPTTLSELATGGNFAVQLAVASSPRGFDALLAKLGPVARNSQRRQLANGSWVLLLGSFDSMADARNGIPSGVAGAFARDTSTLNFR